MFSNWKVRNMGCGARSYVVVRDDLSFAHVVQFHRSAKGNMIKFESHESAVKRARKLNALESAKETKAATPVATPAETPKQTTNPIHDGAALGSWLWPNRTISKAESGQLREEHNALVNAFDRLVTMRISENRAALAHEVDYPWDARYDSTGGEKPWVVSRRVGGVLEYMSTASGELIRFRHHESAANVARKKRNAAPPTMTTPSGKVVPLANGGLVPANSARVSAMIDPATAYVRRPTAHDPLTIGRDACRIIIEELATLQENHNTRAPSVLRAAIRRFATTVRPLIPDYDQ